MRLRPGLVHHQVAIAEETPVQHLDGLGGFLFGRHLDETETPRPSGKLVGDDPNLFHGSSLGEQLPQILLRGLKGEITDEQLCRHHEPPAAIKTECTALPGSHAACGVPHTPEDASAKRGKAR